MTVRPPRLSLWPRVRGAYVQLGVAMAAALVLAPSLRSGAQAVFTTALFLASEPLLVVLGRRGEARPEEQRDAWKRLSLLRAFALVGGVLAWAGQPLARVSSLIPAALLGLAWFRVLQTRRERTWAGELLAALGLPAAALAVAGAGGAPALAAVGLALVLGAVFGLGMLLVHLHRAALDRVGGSGLRLGAFLGGVALVGATWIMGCAGLLPRAAFTALLPMVLAGLGLWLVTPRPWQVKAVGRITTVCALAGAVLAVALFRVR